MSKVKIVQTVGKRKKAVAQALVKPGTGKIKINGKPLEFFATDILRMKISEPMIIAGEKANAFDFHVTVVGGGVAGQSDAVRQSVAKALIESVKDKSLEETFLNYDRNMLIADPRRTEPHKPSQSSKGPRHRKQFSKR